jgi:hypothetical protein
MEIKKYAFDDGKYEVQAAHDGSSLKAYRHGEFWQNMIGDNLTAAMLNRIDDLEEMLRWYVEEDEINEGDPENQYWIDGKHKAMKLLGIEIEE